MFYIISEAVKYAILKHLLCTYLHLCCLGCGKDNKMLRLSIPNMADVTVFLSVKRVARGTSFRASEATKLGYSSFFHKMVCLHMVYAYSLISLNHLFISY